MSYKKKENYSLEHNDIAKKYKVSIIVAYDRNLGIGKNGKMAWHCSADLKHFATLTANHIVVMGYNTYLAIGKTPLPGRKNVVITDHHKAQVVEGFEVFLNIYDFLAKYEKEAIFCIGGATLYKAFLQFASKMYITELQTAANVDTFFPNYDCRDWMCVERRFVNFDKDTKCAIEYRTLKRLY
jgi:dihydrofolate reductase